jgi:hypothetical protein
MTVKLDDQVNCWDLLKTIDKEYNEATRIGLLQWIFEDKVGTSSNVTGNNEGWKAFKQRFLDAIECNNKINFADRVYILDLAKRVFLNMVPGLKYSNGSNDYSQELPTSKKF